MACEHAAVHLYVSVGPLVHHFPVTRATVDLHAAADAPGNAETACRKKAAELSELQPEGLVTHPEEVEQPTCHR